MEAFHSFPGADNTSEQIASGSNLCSGPHNCVLHQRARPNLTFVAQDRVAANLGGRIDLRCSGNGEGPIRIRHVCGPPAALGDGFMDLQIFRAGADVEPLAIFHNNSADFAAVADPVNQDGNERDLLRHANPVENFRIPYGNIRIVVKPRLTRCLNDINDAPVLQDHARGQARFSQSQSDIISAPAMLVDQRSQIEISQNVAAIDKEGLLSQKRFGILNTATRLEQIGFMNKLDGTVTISPATEQRLKVL